MGRRTSIFERVKRSDGSLLYLVFIAPDKDFGNLRPEFEKMLKSVQVK